jgi:hypothetical protein
LNADTKSGTRGPGIGAAAFVPAAVVVVVAVGLLWTAGNLSALVTHGQRPQATLEDMGAVAIRLVQHPGEPGAAWSAADRRLIPSAAWFYATLLVLAGLTAVLLVVGWRSYQRLQAALPGTGGYGAAWATRRDLATWWSTRAPT